MGIKFRVITKVDELLNIVAVHTEVVDAKHTERERDVLMHQTFMIILIARLLGGRFVILTSPPEDLKGESTYFEIIFKNKIMFDKFNESIKNWPA